MLTPSIEPDARNTCRTRWRDFCHPGSVVRVLMGLACLIGAAQQTSGFEDESRKRRDEFALIFDSGILADNSARVVQLSRGLQGDQRFAYLRSWVLPKQTGTMIRWSADFHPVNIQNSDSPNHVFQPDTGSIVHSGSIVAPALELIDIATFDELQSLIAGVSDLDPQTEEQAKQKSAFLAICYLKSQQQTLANEQIRLLIDLARQFPGTSPERCAELAVLSRITALSHMTEANLLNASEVESLREMATELSVVLLDDIRSERFQRSERWKHHVSAMKFRLDSNVFAVQPGITGPDGMVPVKSWISVSETNAESRGRGYPVSMWLASQGSIKHVSGHHNHDYVYYASPLTGDFSVEADTTTFDLHDIHLAYGGIWSGAAWDGRLALHGTFRFDMPNIPLDPPLTRMFDTMRVRLSVSDRIRRTYVNGRLIHQNALTEHHDPWLAIHSWWLTDGSVRNLRITGTPIIPQTIRMITPDLDGWTSYYNESVGWGNADWKVSVIESGESDNVQESIEIHGSRRSEVADSFSEALLRYHRPMMEDGTIEYDFFYQANQSITHPALDRLCLILRPDGVYTHWATDGRYDPTTIGPDNLAFDQASQRHGGKLPLIDGNWNHVTLSLTTRSDNQRSQQVLEISLNGSLVFTRPIEQSNDRTFGLFHWADQSEVRVRDLRWSGSWPRTVPEPAEQELADLTLDRELGDRNRLKEYLNYSFGRGIETGTVSIRGADWESNAVRKPDGLRLRRLGGEYTNYLIAAPMALSGDFDVIAEFEDLEIEAHPGGEGNIQLNLIVDDDRSSEYVLYRKHYVLDNGTHEQVLHTSLAQKRGNEFQYTFFEAPAEESITGRMRMVRRGTTIYFLYAERDSSHERLVHRETITQDDVRVRLVNGHHKDGFTTVTWKSLNIRAEAATGSLASPIKTLAQLDQEREALPARRTWDFRTPDTQSPNTQSVWQNELTQFGGIGTFSDSEQGLEILVPGSNDWRAAGLVSRQSISGDFDISLRLEMVHIEPCTPHQETCVLLLTELPDAKKSTIETKFSIHSEGDTKAETQIRRLRKDGEFDYQELVSQTSQSPVLLRLARRGTTIYQIYQGTEHSQPQILGAVELSAEQVSPGYLRALIHTGGDNRKTIVRFHTLDVHASEIQ